MQVHHYFAVLLLLVTHPAYSLPDDVTAEDIQRAAKDGLAQFESMISLEKELLDRGMTVRRGSPAHMHAHMTKSSPSSREAVFRAVKIVSASQKLSQQFDWSAEEAQEKLATISLAGTDLKNLCPESIICPEDLKYSPIDGSCHNLRNPDWGKSETPYQRVMNNSYADGVWTPRNGTGTLNSPRQVSNDFITPLGNNEETSTLMLMTWGQFITHDLTRATPYTSQNGQTPRCCDNDGNHLSSDLLHPFCLPIDISKTDPFYQQFNRTCMEFVRTQIGGDYQCTFNHAEQLNAITHWLDGSTVYGSTSTLLKLIRSDVDGLLKTSITDEKEYLPVSENCDTTTNACFYAGDDRVQDNPQLTITHTLFMREHNRLARELKNINPHWNAETLFQEARRIVVAEIQHITYNEYLPAMLGNQAMGDYKLMTAPSGSFSVYDEATASNPSIVNEFAAAAFRVGHSQIPKTLVLFDENDKQNNDQTFTLSSYFNNAYRITEPGFLDNALRGLTKQLPNQINSGYTREMTDLLFKGSNPYGMDIVALNIQRAREHGIPDYNTMREYCGLRKAETFDDLSGEIVPSVLNNLRKAYRSVDDIDLYIGCLAEATIPVNGSLLGSTALCLVAQQFALTKNNDRYFYDVGQQTNSFNLTQLDEIRKTSLARVMCDNSNGVFSSVQQLAIKAPTGSNGKVQCSAIPSIDLTYWRENSPTTTTEKPSSAPSKESFASYSIMITVLLSVFLFLKF